MSSAFDHISLANRNQAALEYLLLDADRCAEVIAITAFYKAVHVVEAMFDWETGFHSNDHWEREDRIKKHGRLKACWSNYRILKNASLVARYLSVQAAGRNVSTFSQYMQSARLKQVLLDGRLKDFEKIILPWLPEKHGLTFYQ